MKRRNYIKVGKLKGLESCSGVRWRCDSKNACYGALGKGRSVYERVLMRVECVPNGKCKAEVLVGRLMFGRKRGLKNMAEAKAWACERAKRG
jgi:hypothetical protein